LYDAGREHERQERDTNNAADMSVIDDYTRRNPTVPLPAACKPVVGSSSSKPSMVGECRQDVESMNRIDKYFKTHPNARRSDDCSLPLRAGFLGECLVQVEAASEPLPPPAEWHRIIKDTIGCYRNGVYSEGLFVGTTNGCMEIHAGQVFLLRPIRFLGKDGKFIFLPPLSGKQISVSNGVSSLTLPTKAFDPKILHCQSKQVLLHTEVTCTD
jgi:hypothetical protein